MSASTIFSDYIGTVSHGIIVLSAVILLSYIIHIIYDVLYGPLSKVPGPFWYKVSGLPLAYMQATGREAETLPVLHERYGPVVRIAPNELSYISGTEAWIDLYGFRKAGPPKPSKDPIMYVRTVTEFQSISIADDDNHARQRRVLAPAFGDAALRAMQPLLTAWAAKMRTKIAAQIRPGGGGGGGTKMDMVRIFQFTTFDVMGDLTFGEGLNMLDGGQYIPWVQTLLDGIKLDAWIRIAKHFRLGSLLADALMNTKTARAKHWEHYKYSKDRVDKRLARTAAGRPDFWSFILKKDEKQGGFSMGEQYENASLFMIGGTETTATVLCGATYFLAQNPEIMKRAQAEVRSAFDDLENMTIERLAGLKYLNACLQETMRLYPPVPCALLRRTPAEGASICGTWIPGDVSVGVHIFATHTSPLHFKNPRQFHPERWLGDPDYARDHLGAWAPFGVGPRNCLGKNLAWHEARLLLATLLMHFDVSVAEESQVWARQRVFTLWEKPPLLCNVRLASA